MSSRCLNLMSIRNVKLNAKKIVLEMFSRCLNLISIKNVKLYVKKGMIKGIFFKKLTNFLGLISFQTQKNPVGFFGFGFLCQPCFLYTNVPEFRVMNG